MTPPTKSGKDEQEERRAKRRKAAGEPTPLPKLDPTPKQDEPSDPTPAAVHQLPRRVIKTPQDIGEMRVAVEQQDLRWRVYARQLEATNADLRVKIAAMELEALKKAAAEKSMDARRAINEVLVATQPKLPAGYAAKLYDDAAGIVVARFDPTNAGRTLPT